MDRTIKNNLQLNDEQLAASRQLNGSTMVIAVPGAGKTTILLERIKNLINTGVDPEKILNISFSRSAAKELSERFATQMEVEKSPDFQTIHAFTFMILREYGKKHQINYRLLEGHPTLSKYKIITDIYRHHNNYEFLPLEKIEGLLNDIGYIKNMMLEPDDQDFQPSVKNFPEIYRDYEKYKRERNLIDFDDMLSLGLEALQNDQGIKNKYIRKYDYIQVDEGQDTSKVQMEIIKLLTIEKNNLYIVADDDQSIYSFRGADPQGIFDLRDIYKDLKVYYMETNYRSSKNIITASDRFIKTNTKRFKKNLKSYKDYQDPVDIVKVTEVRDQYSYIEESLKKDWDSSAILYRNNISAMGAIEYLERRDIPFRIRDSSRISFYNNKVTRDLLSILKFSEDLSDLQSLNQIFYKVEGYISRVQMNYLNNRGCKDNCLDTILQMPGCPDYSKNSLKSLERKLKILTSLNFKEKLLYIGKELGYINYLAKIGDTPDQTFYNHLSIYQALLEISQQSEDLDTFLGRLKYLDELTRQSKHNTKGVTLSTIHSAKGQEYDSVYMIDVYEGSFINSEKDTEPEDIEEERRLFYVGMTRARDHLTIMYPSMVGTEKTEENIFVKELKNL